jgi:CheY-like chemotaxis protein
LKILYIDDEPKNRLVVERALTREDFGSHEVRTVRDTLEATEILETFVPDVVVSDNDMRYANEGSEFLIDLKETPAHHAVVFILTSGKNEDLLEAFVEEHGLDGFLARPWNARELLDFIEQAVAKRNAT